MLGASEVGVGVKTCSQAVAEFEKGGYTNFRNRQSRCKAIPALLWVDLHTWIDISSCKHTGAAADSLGKSRLPHQQRAGQSHAKHSPAARASRAGVKHLCARGAGSPVP